MIPYRRPTIAPVEFRDDDGRVIDYGNRWGWGGPPEDTYSVTAHPERFAPLRVVAQALIDWLTESYDVAVTDDLAAASDLTTERADVIRAVRLSPSDELAAPLTFVFTAFPGIMLHAGMSHDFAYPPCGCDACDNSWESVADDLESRAIRTADDGYLEDLERPGAQPVSRQGWGPGAPEDERRTIAEAIADSLARGPRARVQVRRWRPWQPRPRPGETPTMRIR